jgi:hypothetical protein
VLVVMAARPVDAQSLQVAPPTGDSGRPAAQALRVAEGPTMDGDVLNDPIWAQAQPIGGFVQYQPNEGQPVSERTEVRMIFTRDTLFVGVVCYDSDPNGIIVADSRRDTSLDNTDSFRMIFDTYRDFQNGFVFGTNPAGIEYDGQVTNEGRGAAGCQRQMQMGGSGGGFNLNWDGAWEVRTRTTDIGWSAEFAIPFKTLRYPSGARPDLGRQLPAQHPPQERAVLLVAGFPASSTSTACRLPGPSPASNRRCSATQAHAVRAGTGQPVGVQPGEQLGWATSAPTRSTTSRPA